MDPSPIPGGCLCGAVTFRVTPEFTGFKYCFCSRCRKRSGSVHAANLFTAGANFQWRTGEECVTHFVAPDTGKVMNAFCRTCGSRVPRVTERGVMIPAGSLEASPGIAPEHCIYWDSRADWLPLPDALEKLPESAQQS